VRRLTDKELLLSAEGRISKQEYRQGRWTLTKYLFPPMLLVFFLFPLGASLTVVYGAGVVLSLVSAYCAVVMMIKRLHDRDRSGWWTLMNLVPVVGWIWLGLECRYRDGVVGPNQFGPDPLNPPSVADAFG